MGTTGSFSTILKVEYFGDCLIDFLHSEPLFKNEFACWGVIFFLKSRLTKNVNTGFSPEGYRMSRPTCVKNCPLFHDMLKNSRHAFSRDATSFFPAASVVVHQSILTNLHRYFYCRCNGSLMSISNIASVE